MNVYSIDLKVCATVYIKASSAAEALDKARKLTMRSFAIMDNDGDVPLSGLKYDDPNLPEISASPAMTIHGIWSEFEEKEAAISLAHMDVEETRR